MTNDPIVPLVEQIIGSQLPLKEKKELLNEVRKIMAPEQNRWNLRFVIWTLALLSLSIPIIVLLKIGSVPEGLLSLGSAAVGALAGFLTPFSQKKTEAPSVQLPVTVAPNTTPNPAPAPNAAPNPIANPNANPNQAPNP